MSTLPPQMLPPNMPMSLAPPTQPSAIPNMPLTSTIPSNSSASAMSGLHQNTSFYPMQVFYYPTPSIYLQTGQMHPGPMTLVLRGKSFPEVSHF